MTADTPKRITILGSTGSIGASTLDLVQACSDQQTAPELVALTAHTNVEKLLEQARRFRPALAVIGDERLGPILKEGLDGTGIETASGPAGLLEAARRPSDLVVAGIVGAAGLAPTLESVAHTKAIALANKECLVCAGALFTGAVSRAGVALIPVDSEHNAIYQVFDFEAAETVSRLILTASGGPFREASLAHMAQVSPAQALDHPTWSMGAKISIDSATMMNKGLEMIEAFHLFPVRAEQIEAVVHPQSIVHSFVEYVDGSMLAQLGCPDMRVPLSLALAWPERMETDCERLSFHEALNLTFEPTDEKRFPALRLARQALQQGGSAPTVLNAANEVAVAAFLEERLGFLEICRVVEACLEALPGPASPPSALEEVMALDEEARATANEMIDAQRQTSLFTVTG